MLQERLWEVGISVGGGGGGLVGVFDGWPGPRGSNGGLRLNKGDSGEATCSDFCFE